MAELADALVLGTSGQPCRFKSCYPHQKSKLFSPACEQVLGAQWAPAELRRRKEFFHFMERQRKVARESNFGFAPFLVRALCEQKARGSKLPQALAEDLFRERELLRHFGGRMDFSLSAEQKLR